MRVSKYGGVDSDHGIAGGGQFSDNAELWHVISIQLACSSRNSWNLRLDRDVHAVVGSSAINDSGRVNSAINHHPLAFAAESRCG